MARAFQAGCAILVLPEARSISHHDHFVHKKSGKYAVKPRGPAPGSAVEPAGVAPRCAPAALLKPGFVPLQVEGESISLSRRA